MKKLFFILLLSLIEFISSAQDENYSSLTWPRELTSTKNKVTLYQPQLEEFAGNNLEARMAISVKTKDDLVFGAVWLKSIVSTDLVERTVTLENIDVSKVNFPGLTDPEKIKSYSTMLENELESWNIVMSLDRLIASMAEIENHNTQSAKLNNNPPVIYFRTTPSQLISIDGDPFYKEDDTFDLEYVVNTAFFIVHYKDNYYIKEGKFWYESSNELSGYKSIKNAPAKVEEFAGKYGKDIVIDSAEMAMEVAPELIIATQPSELISTDGDPDYQSIEGTSLLYAANTEDDILLDINTQMHYILIAGRWYYSKSLDDANWVFQEPENLPEDFALIPTTSPVSNVRASVPNTEEAQDAILEQSIPQTAQVDRQNTSVEVKYDGEPKFEHIKGTSISCAINTDKSVLFIDNMYYCVDDAIWFVSDKATGPWVVSVERPEEVDDLPPDSPVYNVKYVYIYESTPEIVYVGYYPGYTYSFAYGGTIVYGTGYYYPYWYGTYYYPRPITYGYGVHYNPYTGWGFTVGISVGWGYHPYGYWGPAGYHYGYRNGYNAGYRRGYHDAYHRGYNQGARAGYAAGKRSNTNVYANRSSGIKQSGNINRANAANKLNDRSRPSQKPNNMYADKRGEVYEQKKNGTWENKTNGVRANDKADSGKQIKQNTQKQVNQPTPAQKQQSNQRSSVNKSTMQQLNRDAQSRTRGTQNYNRANTGVTRSGGGVRRR